MTRAPFPIAAGLALAALAALSALAFPAAAESLQQARLKVFQGTASGITLFGSTPAPSASAPAMAAPAPAATTAAPSAAAASAATARTAPAAPAAADTRTLAERVGAALRTAPPSGETMSAGKRLDAPSAGIPLPTAAAASAAADTPLKGR